MSNPKEAFRSTGFSSHKLGLCEVCAEHAPEVFMRTYGPITLFGHVDCLKKVTTEDRARRYKELFYEMYHYGDNEGDELLP